MHVEILERRIVNLEVTIQMLSYNLRCLNIRQGSQPIELEQTAPRKCTVEDFENMVDTLVINEDRRYQDEMDYIRRVNALNRPFGEDQTAWAK